MGGSFFSLVVGDWREGSGRVVGPGGRLRGMVEASGLAFPF